MTLISELDKIIELLEAEIPANPENPKNLRLKNQFTISLAAYFRKLEDAFPYSKLDSIYNKNVKESLGSDTRGVLDPLLATFDATLKATVTEHLIEIYLSGQAEMITWGKTKGGIPIAYEGPPIKNAIAWAEKHGAQLVTQMDEETKRRLAQHIADGINNKSGIPNLARDIRTQFGDMTKFRSQMIARTETASALSQASLDNMKDMGVEGKQWVVNNPENCVCVDNDGVIVGVDDTFPSGHSAPPAHPNCECALAPARLPK